MARHLDELLGAQDAMARRHERWRAELEELFAGVDPHRWKAQADGLGGFRASMLEEELRVKEPPPAWMSEAAPLSPPPKRPPPPPPNQGERKAPAQQPTQPPPALPVVSKLERAASKKEPPPPPRGDHPQDVIPGPSSAGASLAAGGPRGDHPREVIPPGPSAGDPPPPPSQGESKAPAREQNERSASSPTTTKPPPPLFVAPGVLYRGGCHAGAAGDPPPPPGQGERHAPAQEQNRLLASSPITTKPPPQLLLFSRVFRGGSHDGETAQGERRTQEEPARGLVKRPPPEPLGPKGGPPDLEERIYAIETQTQELWLLNQRCKTNFEYLLDAAHHAFECDRIISAAECRRLERINQYGNDAKHKGLGFGGCAGRAGRAGSCSPTFGRCRDRVRTHIPSLFAWGAPSGAPSSSDPPVTLRI